MEKIPEAIGWGMIPFLMRISALPGYRYGVALLEEMVSSHSSGHIPSGAKIQSQKA